MGSPAIIERTSMLLWFHTSQTCSTKQNGRVRARMGPEGLKTLSSLQIRELQQDITMDEVRQAVRDCDGSKAPSPDGFTFTFYKKALLLTGMVSEFFKNGKLPNGIDTTNVTYIGST
ncbi:hypothetical protein OIU78_012377 [Salix suchowensis]|nr:hypothetical protein OIU78_012377 [Salix suchowensis]